MFNEGVFNQGGTGTPPRLTATSGSSLAGQSAAKRLVIGAILIVALFAFELFNFDTTRFALDYILGNVSFWGIRWATILAVAFCAIDFAGLARLFTPEQGEDEPKAVWYLMGAWLLGATMNALMTWWAVSLTLLGHEFGNEVLNREQLLHIVPIFVAALVWLTRILFIGSLSVAGEQLLDPTGKEALSRESAAQTMRSVSERRPPAPASRPKDSRGSGRIHGQLPTSVMAAPRGRRSSQPVRANSVNRRSRPMPVGMQARGRRR